jgi:hypothetical protein
MNFFSQNLVTKNSQKNPLVFRILLKIELPIDQKKIPIKKRFANKRWKILQTYIMNFIHHGISSICVCVCMWVIDPSSTN